MPDALLTEIAGGSAGAVDAFVRRYGNAVWSVARRYCASAEDAEDATQEVFLDVWRSAGRFDPEAGSELTFVLTIARRRLIDRARREGRRPRPEPLDDPSALESPEVTDDPARDELERARAAMERLKPEQRKVLDLALGEGRTHQEISAAIGIPLGTVKSHARRGLLRLRAMLGEDGGAEGDR